MKIIHAFSVIFVFLFALLLQGCIGLAVNNSRTRTFQEPLLADSASPSYVYERITSLKELQAEEERTKSDLSWMTNRVAYTSAWLETHWGKPASITHAGADGLNEIWIYKFDFIWEGIEPFIVVPIPLELPVRREAVQFVLHDGRVIRVLRVEPARVGGIAGLLLTPEAPVIGVSSLNTK